MREKLKDKSRLAHIIEAIDNVLEFTDNENFESFKANKMLRFAVIKNLEIIGEASYRLTNEFKTEHPEIEWQVIIDMRHILVHGYYQIEDDIAWSVIQKDLQPLKTKIQPLLK